MAKHSEQYKLTTTMKLLKLGHNISGSNTSSNLKDINQYRIKQEKMAKVATSNSKVEYLNSTLSDMNLLWTYPVENADSSKLIVYCHGGGFSTGGEEYSRVLSRKLAITTGYKTVAHMYRLSPEFKYPAAIEDTIMLWNHLISDGFLPQNIILTGDSAGGNLALELCFYLKERNMELPGCLILMSPWTDMTMVSKSYIYNKDIDPILSPEYIDNARYNYLGEVENYKDPKFSPLYGDFEGFPPTLIQVGTHEILKNDSTRLAYRMKKKGVRVRLEIYKECWHVFQSMPTISSIKAFKNISKFLEGV